MSGNKSLRRERSLFYWSRWFHKYAGLFFLAIACCLASTGILINHPSLLSHWSVPVNWLGQSYQYSNWNRFSFRDSLLPGDDSIFIAGKMGVFYSPQSGSAFQAINRGLPESFYLRDTNCLLATEYNGQQRLFAGGRSGLYFRGQHTGEWQFVSSVGTENVVDLLRDGDRILAFTAHACFAAPVGQDNPVFSQVDLAMDTKDKRVPAFRLLFELHSGKLFGLPGRLFIDFSALLLLFLCVSALYIWYLPWSRRKFARRKKRSLLFSYLYSYHLTVGIWVAVVLLIIGGSGALVRPPLILLASYWQIPFTWLNQEIPEILRAAISDDGLLLLATRDGLYKGDSTLEAPLSPVTPPLPVFGMGTTVLESIGDNTFLLGSFSGLYKWDLKANSAVDLQGKRAVDSGQLRPGEVMAAGVLIDKGILRGYADYTRGLQPVDDIPLMDRPFSAEQLESRTSLYHFLFELHNGRFLRDLIGAWYILYVPLAGMTLVLIVLTGTYDWLKRKMNRLRRRQGG